ncbi:MAG: tRNA pseudouridine(54/55) synthase Pus10 [Methermicoccaceae archaeon]
MILDDARTVLSEGYVCDHCLGRLFGILSTGLSNNERGKAVRTVLALEDDVRDGQLLNAHDECWICNGLFKHLNEWAERATVALEAYEFDTYLVGTHLPGMLAASEELAWSMLSELHAEPMKAELNREVGKLIGEATGKSVEFEHPDVVVLLEVGEEAVDVKASPVFIMGRYCKLVRGIPQTRWPHRACKGKGCEECGFTGKQYPESVDELISAPVLGAFLAQDTTFHGSGREDIDARMLGRGRPFVLEVVAPKRRSAELKELESTINEHADGKVEVRGLTYTTRESVGRLKAAKYPKRYGFVVMLDEEVSKEQLCCALEALTATVISQQTPKRVAHRRADKIRERQVYEAELKALDGKKAQIELRCESGTYVKELISGDEGRTNPSLSGLLGVGAVVCELDVLDVEDD